MPLGDARDGDDELVGEVEARGFLLRPGRSRPDGRGSAEALCHAPPQGIGKRRVDRPTGCGMGALERRERGGCLSARRLELGEVCEPVHRVTT